MESELWEQNLRTNVLFLKIQKTGSTTMQNILFRFSSSYSLDTMLPETSNVIAYDRPMDNSLSDNLLPIDGKFNIFACISRYHPSINKYMHDDTVRITILRDPSTYFVSLYNFFKDANSLQVRLNMTFDKFLSSLPNKPTNLRRTNRFQKGVNQMCYELGLDDADNPSESVVDDFIEYIDKEFDFVMITEYYEECLILFADLMGWPLKYVAYLIHKFPSSSKYDLTETDTKNLRELNSADTRLYDHFLNKFVERVRQYGAQRLMTNLRLLDRFNEDLRRKCVEHESSSSNGTVEYKLKHYADGECVYATMPEMIFINELRDTQINQFKEEKGILNFVQNKR